MSRITGTERRHWHDAEGRHRMPDPRKFNDGQYPERFWDSDERAYVEHLKAHELRTHVPQPEDSDSDTIKALFGSIELHQQIIETTRALIVHLRNDHS